MKKEFKIKKNLNTEIKIPLFIVLIFLCFFLFSLVISYREGYLTGYYYKEYEINKEKNMEQMMNLSTDKVKEIFLKNIMIKTMNFYYFILLALIIKWIVHGRLL